MNGRRIMIKVHHDLFVSASSGDAGWPHEWEIAKVDDDGYLVWNFAHDPTAKVGPLFSDQLCAFRIESDGTYSCGEKAVTVCPDGFCLFHMKKDDVRVITQRIGGVLWDTFQMEYMSRLKERVESGVYDFRGFEILPNQGLAGQPLRPLRTLEMRSCAACDSTRASSSPSHVLTVPSLIGLFPSMTRFSRER